MIELFYLIAGVLFIVALKALTSPRTARVGNLIAAGGMLLAVVGTLAVAKVVTYQWIVIGLLIGGGLGAFLALKVKMTAMPQMVSSFNGSGGLAAALVAIVEFWHPSAGQTGGQFAVIAGIGGLIGWVTLTGSIIAVLKLQEIMKGRPIVYKFQREGNLLLLAAAVIFIILLGVQPDNHLLMIPVIALACVLGVLIVIPVGGADMPVVISLLNSFTGLAAAATGFLLGNSGLIISGALVGASGAILTQLMCKAMNRSLPNVMFGEIAAAAAPAEARRERKTVRNYTAEDAAIVLKNASSIVVIPGYGLAVARAQHALKEFSELLQKQGVKVGYAIHPVAGRMPGHMNVLMAEADVPYSQLLDLDQGNAELEQADVALVIGANDVINPAAIDDPHSPIYGMPILHADYAKTVMIIKRSLSPGFAGIDNALFYRDGTMMLFGDAKEMLTELVKAMKAE